MNKATILMVEDDLNILRTNGKALEMEGYRVLEADTLAAGRALVERENPDLIVLDIILPDGSGLNYCEELRSKSGIRILFLSALNTSEDFVAGLRAGGDDYISKPYDMDVLMARVEALLRRGRLLDREEDPLRIGTLSLDILSRRAYLAGKDLLLKPREFSLMEVLVRQQGEPISAQELYERVWGLDAADDVRTVWVHISVLRKKLGEPEKTGGPWLLFSRNNGYFLTLEEP